MKFKLIFACFFTGFTALFSQSNIDRIEPPNWWVGMQHPTVQLLVHGNNIGDLNPQINYPGVRLERTIKVENQNYLFLDLSIEKSAIAGTVQIDFFQNDKLEESQDWELLKRDPNSALRKGFDNTDVLYLITPDRFANGDPSNDYVEGYKERPDRQNPGGRHGGDIEGIRKNLDYLVDMGFTAIWLNPLLENDMEKYSYHGYSTTDFYKVDPRFGSNESYQKLVKEAEEKGIHVIMDMIVNHCGLQHWWADDLPTKDWYNEFIGYTNHRKSATQDPYVAEVDKRLFFDGWFVETMPDLNQRNPLMANYLIQNAIWWVEYSGVRGIRMDTYPYPEPDFMTVWTERMAEEYPNFNTVGEEWNYNPNIVAYWQKGKENPDGYTSELPSIMDFPLQDALAKSLVEKETWGKGWIKLYEMLAQDFVYADPMSLVVFPDNHDMPRFYAQMGEDENLVKLGLTYVLTTRGIPQLYYGTEILMNSPAQRNDGLIRSDFPGGWEGDEINAMTEKGLSEVQIEMKKFLKKILNWRKTSTAVQTGKLIHFDPMEKVYVYFRYDEKQKIMVILNKNDKSYNLELNRFEQMLAGVKSGRDIFSEKEFLMNEKIALPVMSPLVLELK